MSIAVPVRPLSEEILFEEHHKKVEAEARAKAADDVQRVNLDSASAVTTVLALLPGFRRYRDQIIATLKDFNIERFDKLEDYTKAFSVANSRYMTATRQPDALSEDHDEGLKVRELLHADVVNLIARGYIKAEALKDYTGLVGFRNVGVELQTMALLLKDNWATIQGKCGTDPLELENALKLAQRLQLGAGEREVNPAVVAEYSDLRNRMFTLFIEAYDDARRAIQYLRWHEGDAEDIAPTLYVGKGPGASKKKTDKKEESVPAPAASGVQNEAATTTVNSDTNKTSTDVAANGPFMK